MFVSYNFLFYVIPRIFWYATIECVLCTFRKWTFGAGLVNVPACCLVQCVINISSISVLFIGYFNLSCFYIRSVVSLAKNAVGILCFSMLIYVAVFYHLHIWLAKFVQSQRMSILVILWSCHLFPLYMAVNWATEVELYVESVTACQHSQLNMYVLIMAIFTLA